MKLIYQIKAVFLALLVLASTQGLVIDQHFCGSFLVDTAVNHQADSCGMDSMEKSGCCSNEQIVVEGQDELQLQVAASLDFQFILPSLEHSYDFIYQAPLVEQNTALGFLEESPPWKRHDLIILHDQFLI
ncbi:hypothetical protein I5168_00970 [Nonlabens sp. SCSIO 43208]|uniref:HYC_CC_PP family protein n=1 Tax=Nonlabens sp. SCSIO 43208 TaxID=2793009 RepID=UPI003D6A5F06